jgi:hypothetical protein
MFAALLTGVLLAAEPPSEPALTRALELGAGVAITGNTRPPALRLGALLEARGDDHKDTWVSPIVTLDWMHAAWAAPLGPGKINTLDLQAGVRFGMKWGPVLELLGGVAIGGGLRLLSHAAGTWAELGLTWMFNAGLRFSLGERWLLTVTPAELKGALWLSPPNSWDHVSLAFAPSISVGVRL